MAETRLPVERARLMTQRAAWRRDTAGGPGWPRAAGIEAAPAALDRASPVHERNGLVSEHALADLWRMTRLLRAAPLSREMVLHLIARHWPGRPDSH